MITVYGGGSWGTALARKLNVEMPITSVMNALLDGRLAPQQAVELLMRRSLKEESA